MSRGFIPETPHEGEGIGVKILLAIDGSACGQAALDEVVRRPWPAGSELRIVSVVEFPHLSGSEPWVMPNSYIEQLENAEADRVQALVSRAVASVRNDGDPALKVTGEVLRIGDPKAVILEDAEQWGADLIVLGSHGRHGWQRYWLGSVSLAVATRAHCSVEIVRSQA
jgi:nucleotide-binding universal stress UspA family protein